MVTIRTSMAMLVAVGLGTSLLAGCTGGNAGGPPVGSEAWLGSRDTDKDKDGTYSRDEVNEAFTAADTNGDGHLSASERGSSR
jgi:hypothetical protein